jgi:hypothetical protein
MLTCYVRVPRWVGRATLRHRDRPSGNGWILSERRANRQLSCSRVRTACFRSPMEEWPNKC